MYSKDGGRTLTIRPHFDNSVSSTVRMEPHSETSISSTARTEPHSDNSVSCMARMDPNYDNSTAVANERAVSPLYLTLTILLFNLLRQCHRHSSDGYGRTFHTR
ncbi:hypothetical protein PoB_004098400 [Plakobranchus ocellatus]|uniref:Uncharacterized protein n=1 Tax=Plakobranchus ocellatus TaxID=259542 RepID=A0AAV4B362_9GAST|nr:hypothetical protein PoB_004098400 [Plakobranchus ocellatus]